MLAVFFCRKRSHLLSCQGADSITPPTLTPPAYRCRCVRSEEELFQTERSIKPPVRLPPASSFSAADGLSLIKASGCCSELAAVRRKLQIRAADETTGVFCSSLKRYRQQSLSRSSNSNHLCCEIYKEKNIYEATSCDQTAKQIRTERTCPLLSLFFSPSSSDRNLWSEKFSCRCWSSD